MRNAVMGIILLLLFLSSCHFIPVYEQEKSVALELGLDLSTDLEEDAIEVPEHFFSGEQDRLC